MSAVSVAFGKASADNRAALVGYLPAGFPTVDGAIAAAQAMAQAGADIIEVGLPYSDPLMDGPVIAEAVQRALAAGTRVADVLRTVEAVAAAGVPVLVMTYWNPVDRYGVRAFARDLAAAGGSGLITPDLPPEEAGAWLDASDEQRPGPGVPGRAEFDRPAAGHDRRSLPRLRLRRLADGHHRHQGRGQRRRGRPGRADPRAHRPAGGGRPRRQQRRPGGPGGGVRRRRDRRFRLRPPAG